MLKLYFTASLIQKCNSVSISTTYYIQHTANDITYTNGAGAVMATENLIKQEEVQYNVIPAVLVDEAVSDGTAAAADRADE